MRVIAGSARGTRLTGLKGADVRPTLDRVKESFFNMVGPDLSGQWFLDGFAGTGAMGIEALSRGADSAVFVEIQPRAVDVIHANLEKCRFGRDDDSAAPGRGDVLKMGLFQALPLLERRGQRFDIVYLDPPFVLDCYEPCLLTLAASAVVTGATQVVVEHFRKTELKQNYGTLIRIRERRVGDTTLSFFARDAA